MAVQPISISASERIRELSAINSDAASLATHAGLAVNALTNRPLPVNDDDDDDMQLSGTDTSSTTPTVAMRKDAFKQHTQSFTATLQGVFARLRRQAIALEEAGIITSDKSTLATSLPVGLAASHVAQPSPPDRMMNGGLGKFDVAYLNSQGNKVGEEKEAELMQEAKELLEQALAQKSDAV